MLRLPTGLTFTAQGTSITSGNAQGLWTAPIPSTGSYTIHISANSSSATAFYWNRSGNLGDNYQRDCSLQLRYHRRL